MNVLVDRVKKKILLELNVEMMMMMKNLMKDDWMMTMLCDVDLYDDEMDHSKNDLYCSLLMMLWLLFVNLKNVDDYLLDFEDSMVFS